MAFEPEFVIKQMKKFKHSVIGWGMPGRQNKFDWKVNKRLAFGSLLETSIEAILAPGTDQLYSTDRQLASFKQY